MRTPAADDGGLAAVLPAALAAVSGGSPAPLSFDRRPSGVVVLVVDGLGRGLLDDHADLAPTLATAPGPTLDAAFPATTTTNLTTLGTACPPIEHGIVGTGIAVPGHDRTMVSLTWTWDRQLGGPDARGDVVPERFQPCTTVFERACEAGVTATTVLRTEFVPSGLTRAALRGGRIITADDLDTTLEAAVAAAAHGPAIVYAHHGDLDAAGHLAAPGSEAWCTELARVETALTRCLDRLPSDVALVVTADHGMVAVPDEQLVDLADQPQLLAGVGVLAGDPRARQLHVEPGALDEVAAAWREQVGEHGRVATREQAITAGWFGPPDRVRAAVPARIGDLLVLADGAVAWIHRERDPLGGRLPGQHGSLSDAELRVPAVTLMR